MSAELLEAVFAYTGVDNGGDGGLVGGKRRVSRRKEKVETGGVEKGDGPVRAEGAEYTAALSAVVPALEKTKRHATVKVVAYGRGRVGLRTQSVYRNDRGDSPLTFQSSFSMSTAKCSLRCPTDDGC